MDLIQSKKKKLLLLVEKKALQQVVVCSCSTVSFYRRYGTIQLFFSFFSVRGVGGGGVEVGEVPRQEGPEIFDTRDF